MTGRSAAPVAARKASGWPSLAEVPVRHDVPTEPGSRGRVVAGVVALVVFVAATIVLDFVRAARARRRTGDGWLDATWASRSGRTGATAAS